MLKLRSWWHNFWYRKYFVYIVTISMLNSFNIDVSWHNNIFLAVRTLIFSLLNYSSTFLACTVPTSERNLLSLYVAYVANIVVVILVLRKVFLSLLNIKQDILHLGLYFPCLSFPRILNFPQIFQNLLRFRVTILGF